MIFSHKRMKVIFYTLYRHFFTLQIYPNQYFCLRNHLIFSPKTILMRTKKMTLDLTKLFVVLTTMTLFSCEKNVDNPPQKEDVPNEKEEQTSIPQYPLMPSLSYDAKKPDNREPVQELENGMKLVWNDEFNDEKGTKPNEGKWTHEKGMVRNQEAQCYTDNNAFCDGEGNMVIEGRIEKTPNPLYNPEGKNWNQKIEFADYSSASITTQGKYSFRYGQLIVRAKIPTNLGAWPAIWTLGTKREWPANGEIDIMEYYLLNGNQPSIWANACWASNAAWVGAWNSKAIPFSHFTEKDPEWNMKYHIWREEWDENYIRIYLDDELLNEIDLSKTINSNNGGIKDSEGQTGEGENPFQQDHYILLNLALGARGGSPHHPNFPLHYYIDYVRIYQ